MKSKHQFLENASIIDTLQKQIQELNPVDERQTQTQFVEQEQLKKQLEKEIESRGINYKSFIYFILFIYYFENIFIFIFF
mgnify:CR=1 FL=1